MQAIDVFSYQYPVNILSMISTVDMCNINIKEYFILFVKVLVDLSDTVSNIENKSSLQFLSL